MENVARCLTGCIIASYVVPQKVFVLLGDDLQVLRLQSLKECQASE